MCQVHTGAYVLLLAPEIPTIRLAVQDILPPIYITRRTYHYAYARQAQVNRKKGNKKKKKKEILLAVTNHRRKHIPCFPHHQSACCL